VRASCEASYEDWLLTASAGLAGWPGRVNEKTAAKKGEYLPKSVELNRLLGFSYFITGDSMLTIPMKRERKDQGCEARKPVTNALEVRIADHPFLRGMSVAHLATLAIYAMETDFEPGQFIFRTGEIANRFYLLDSGHVSIEAHARGHEPVSVQTVGPGEVLGWSWLFPPYTSHFDARVLDPVKAIFFYGTRLRERCDEDSEFGHELMTRVAEVTIERLAALQKRLLEQPLNR